MIQANFGGKSQQQQSGFKDRSGKHRGQKLEKSAKGKGNKSPNRKEK